MAWQSSSGRCSNWHSSCAGTSVGLACEKQLPVDSKALVDALAGRSPLIDHPLNRHKTHGLSVLPISQRSPIRKPAHIHLIIYALWWIQPFSLERNLVNSEWEVTKVRQRCWACGQWPGRVCEVLRVIWYASTFPIILLLAWFMQFTTVFIQSIDGVVPSQSPVYLDDPFADARKAAVWQAKWLVKCLKGSPTCVWTKQDTYLIIVW